MPAPDDTRPARPAARAQSPLLGVDPAEFARATWWWHDAHWFAAVARRCGLEAANDANLEAVERAARGAVLQLRRQRAITVPRTTGELTDLFRVLWDLFFPAGMYEESAFLEQDGQAVWVGTHCQAYEQAARAGIVEGYRCGCVAFRDGVARGLGIRLHHAVRESLVAGQARCVIAYHVEGPTNCRPSREADVGDGVSDEAGSDCANADAAGP